MKRLLASALLSSVALGTAPAQDTTLVGLWHAKQWFGPELRGELVVQRAAATGAWRATIGGRTTDARMARDTISFDFPAGGRFTGRVAHDARSISGHWIQPRTQLNGRRIATPVVLGACGPRCYAGRVQPLDDTFTFYMEVTTRPNGKLGVFLRNPERNQGRFIRADNISRRGDTIHLRNAQDSTLASGLLQNGVLSLMLRGATFDFERVPSDSFAQYYPRGRRTGTYSYAPPRPRNDGWQVARASDVGMSEEKLADMVRRIINGSIDSANAHRLHGILVARNGKLVLEEYFFGEHADKPHDTRSGSKTFLTVVMGAAMHAGMKVSPTTPVYATLAAASPDLDPKKRAMTLQHLLTMTSGLDCDDNGELRPGNEDILTEQDTNPDWTGMVLGLKMLRDPGERAVYCSINPYLGGEVLSRATGRAFLDLAWELVGAPLQMRPYHIQLSPLGRPYNGGGASFYPRDFLKLAQLYANNGIWNGRRIVSEAWVKESIEPRYRIGSGTVSNYGYLWWLTEYAFQGRRVRAFHASGNGGQYTMFIPELGLVIAAFGGNYADGGNFTTLRQMIPQQILPTVVK